MAKIETYFVVLLGDDGSISTAPEFPEEKIEKSRIVTNYDVYTTAKQIVDEYETNILASKVARTVLNALVPEKTNVSDKVKEALKERGLTPEGE